MTRLSTDLMAEATRLTRSGNAADATALIQSALQGGPSVDLAHGTFGRPVSASRPTAQRTSEVPAKPRIRVINDHVACAPVGGPVGAAVPAGTTVIGSTEGTFSDGVHASHGRTMAYKLFSPTRTDSTPAPLLVMLHGCTQDAGDFAIGTRMNAIAEESGMYVLYPTQSGTANMNKCWNWFEPAHQRRGSGEPAMLADLTRRMISDCPIDPTRVFVAGLSAGGAMALVLAEQYPELFAAVGVHSGLPTGAASSIPEALSLMKRPSASHSSTSTGALPGMSAQSPACMPFRSFSPINGDSAPRQTAGAAPLPMIVFHGTQDQTVNAANAERIVNNWVAASQSGSGAPDWTPHTRMINASPGRQCTVTCHVSQTQPERAGCEYWQLANAGHQWSGGDARGSHTDAAGPDASAEMVRFFLST